ncbi:pseudouridine synthase [Anaerolineales bacterium HSG25]|nr:pseudouridine synthase [Anaerolineales bacterium HSG25]
MKRPAKQTKQHRQQKHRKPTAKPTRTLLFCKPYKVMCSFTDTEGRATVGDYVDVPNVYAAGRLDYDSEGLLLLTSDGNLAHRITHPRHKLPKQYLAQVERIPTEEALTKFRHGLLIKGVMTRPAQVELLPTEPDIFPRSEPIRYRKTVPTAWLKITLTEGKKRQVRRMTAAIGHPTLRLIRSAIGPLRLGTMHPGEWRELTPQELKNLTS